GRGGNQFAHKHASDGGIAIRKMKRVRFFGRSVTARRVTHAWMRPWCELETVKTGQLEDPAIERVDGINSDAKKPVRALLVERNNPRIYFHTFQKKLFVTDAGKTIFFFG